MRPGATFVGLPEEYAPPDACAQRIAALKTLAEREILLEQLPPGGWRRWIEHESRIAIALWIVDGPLDLAGRRAAMLEVPAAWRDAVQALVRTFWKTRDLRAEYRRELAARRATRAERRAA